MRRVHIRISDECYAELMRRAGEATAAESERVSIGTIVERAVAGAEVQVVGTLKVVDDPNDHHHRAGIVMLNGVHGVLTLPVTTPEATYNLTEPKP